MTPAYRKQYGLLNVSRAKSLGSRAAFPPREGVRQTYQWFPEKVDTLEQTMQGKTLSGAARPYINGA